MARWLDELWPEDAARLYDVQETVVSLTQNAATQLVKGDPRRTGLIMSTSSGGGNVLLSLNPAVGVGEGLLVATTVLIFVIQGPGFEMLASQPWYAFTANAGAKTTVIATTLARPTVRPDALPMEVQAAPGSNADEEIRRLLKKQAKWRKRIYRELERRSSYGGTSAATGAGMAGANSSGLRQPNGNLSALFAKAGVFPVQHRPGPTPGRIGGAESGDG